MQSTIAPRPYACLKPPKMATPPHPFRIANFRAYWVARLCMTVAQNAMIIVIGWQTYTIARETMSPSASAAQLGLIGLLQFLPLFVTTPVTGWVADRFDRRWIARATVSLQALCALALALFTYEGAMSLPVLFTVAVLLGLGRAFSGPAFSALAPNLVPRAVLPTAIALSSISWQAGAIVGPALGGYAYAFAPSAAYFLATGAVRRSRSARCCSSRGCRAPWRWAARIRCARSPTASAMSGRTSSSWARSRSICSRYSWRARARCCRSTPMISCMSVREG